MSMFFIMMILCPNINALRLAISTFAIKNNNTNLFYFCDSNYHRSCTIRNKLVTHRARKRRHSAAWNSAANPTSILRTQTHFSTRVRNLLCTSNLLLRQRRSKHSQEAEKRGATTSLLFSSLETSDVLEGSVGREQERERRAKKASYTEMYSMCERMRNIITHYDIRDEQL